MSSTTTKTNVWDSLPVEAQRLIRAQYYEYCKYVTEPAKWAKWLKNHYDLEVNP